jgi:carboxymethylenebutenolidase
MSRIALSALTLIVLDVGVAPQWAVAQTASAIPDAILGNAPPPRGQAVSYVTGEPATKGYLAVPRGTGPIPALIIIHEWNGLVDRVRQVADAFADHGYVTLAADLYRGGTGSGPEENRRRGMRGVG